MNTNGNQASPVIVTTSYAEKNPHGDNRKARRASAKGKRVAARRARSLAGR